MKFSKTFLALVICIVYTLNMYSQFGMSEFRPAMVENIDFASTGNIDVTSESYFSSLNRTISISEVDGSPYINDSFMSVKISSFENLVFSGRFNAYSGQMEIITSPRKAPIALNISTNSYVVEFIEDKKVYQTYNFKDSHGLVGKSFFVKVNSNKISLLK